MLNVVRIRQSLEAFASSSDKLQILRTFPHSDAKLHISPKSLYVLDSSWNPPTRAHLRICTSALLQDRPTERPKRLLLLLATQNADKAQKPAAFEQRIAMMNIFAGDILRAVANPDEASALEPLKDGNIVVDVGVTEEALFLDKSRAIEQIEAYMRLDTEGVKEPMEQIHLTGFDTLIRLLDSKYYPPNHNLQPLEVLFKQHRVRVTRRTDDAWGSREAQDEYLEKIRNGDREDEHCKREWAERIELVEGRKKGEEIVSSTKVRAAAKAGDEQALQKLVTDGVAQRIMEEKLYCDDE